jgi:hypothetical protein
VPTYYFRKDKTGRSKYGGTNYRFEVYKLIKGGFKSLGTFKINTASYYGDVPSVHRFISKKEGYRLTEHNRIKRKDVKVRWL